MPGVNSFNYSGVCYNERCYNERMLQRTVFINKIRMLQRTRRNTTGRPSTRVRVTCSITVFTRERLFMLFVCVRLLMLFIMGRLYVVFTKERLFMLFVCVRLLMLFIRGRLYVVFTKERLLMLLKFTCTVYKI